MLGLTGWVFQVIAITQVCHGMSLYDYYAPDGEISSGLVAEGDVFTLNGKEIRILSGTMHYFRIHPQYWRDTLRKIRAAGVNTVETYVSWNLHEPRQGVFDFGDLDEDMSAFLDVRGFVQIAQEEDLLVIFRPGPYICGEWEFGGLPSWLLRDHTMSIRTMYEPFRTAAAAFFDALLPLVADLQFTKGGPIIMVQIENEYGNFGYGDFPRDTLYLEFLRDNLISNGLDESLFFTSDTPTKAQDLGAVPGVLQTANFKTGGEAELALLKELQPDRPLMVTEFWTGWFDHWLADIHDVWDAQEFASNLEMILQHNASVNMYMFIGGTDFGFLAGANTIDVFPHYAPDVSSYDYGALLSEAGDYSEKYDLAREIIKKYNPLEGIVDHPGFPVAREKAIYTSAPVEDVVDFGTLLNMVNAKYLSNSGPVNMENLPHNDDNGQSYGYLVYTSTVELTEESSLFVHGHVRDMAMVAVNGEIVTKPFNNILNLNHFGWWNGRDQSLSLNGSGSSELTIIVENLGRANYGLPHKLNSQRKGLTEGPVAVDGVQIDEWLMTPLEFTQDFMDNLTICNCWLPYQESLSVPAVYRAHVEVSDPPMDTFLDMRAWGKGVVFVNGFNLGRYWSVGPQKTSYIPAPLLNVGYNEFMIFEQYEAAGEIVFTDVPILQ